MFFKKRTDDRFLVVGLGNPGKKYLYTRHNVGFLALDFIAERNHIKVTRSRFSALTGEGRLGGKAVTLMKPTTFMNLSGQAVAAALKYYKLPPEKLIVICDDIALTPGIIRIRDHGSSGGQNGLRNIEDMIESQNYIRIRIGIGDRKSGDLPDYVLAMPSSADKKAIESRFFDIDEAVKLIVADKLSDAQSRFN